MIIFIILYKSPRITDTTNPNKKISKTSDTKKSLSCRWTWSNPHNP